MKYLVTLKPVIHNTDKHCYSVILEVDWDKKEILRSLKIPSANYDDGKGSYLRSFIQGIDIIDNQIYASCWNFISIIDYTEFKITNAFSHHLMADNHGLDVTENEIYVASTAIDTILCFDRQSLELKWYWRIDDTNLDTKLSVPSIFSSLKKYGFLMGKIANRIGLSNKVKVEFDSNQEYRGKDKRKSPYHNHHVNEVKYHNGKLYVLSKGWNDTVSSPLIEINLKNNMKASFKAPPGSFKGAHDIIIEENRIVVTESKGVSVGWIDHDGKVSSKAISDDRYFVRGIDHSERGYLVGLSYDRINKKGNKHPIIQEYDKDFNKLDSFLQLDQFYPEEIGAAIHNIYKIK